VSGIVYGSLTGTVTRRRKKRPDNLEYVLNGNKIFFPFFLRVKMDLVAKLVLVALVGDKVAVD
jgi:hypothetical protein